MVTELIRKPTQADVEYLIDHVRADDIEEIEAMYGFGVRECLSGIPDLIEHSEVWEVNGKVVAMFGVTPDPDKEGDGIIWMLATEEFDQYAMMFAVRCKKVVEKMVSGFKLVYNYVHSKNTKSIQWLSWLGFKMSEPAPIGHAGELFTRFEMVRNV